MLGYRYPTDTQAEKQAALDWLFEWETLTQRRFDRSFKKLEQAIWLMQEIGIRGHEDRTLVDLKAQARFQGRTFFSRTGAIQIESGSLEDKHAAGEQPQWGFPRFGGATTLIFTLHSADFSRELQIKMEVGNGRERVWQSDDGIQLTFRRDQYISCELSFLRSKKPYSPREEVRLNQEEVWQNHLIEALQAQGFDGVWRRLDKIWLDLSASRPMNRVLTAQSLGSRYWTLNTSSVKVFTVRGAFAGTWQNAAINTNGKITALGIQAADGFSSVEIQANEVFEILPCRLELED